MEDGRIKLWGFFNIDLYIIGAKINVKHISSYVANICIYKYIVRYEYGLRE